MPSVPFIWLYCLAAWSTTLSRVAYKILNIAGAQYCNITLNNVLACCFSSVAK